jgi:predicted ATPase
MAEGGVGKSRLFYEFKATSQSGWMVLEAFPVSHGKATAYLPVLELLHEYFRIGADDDARTRREKVNGKVLTLDRGLEDTPPYFFGLLGLIEADDPLAQMDGQVRKRRTLEALKRILLRESLNQPLMVIFEDLHWIDEQTQEFLNLLAESIGTAKILLLVNYRPEYSHQWNSKTYYTQLRLDPLGRESAAEMLASLLGDGNELGALKRLIIEKTEGTPFFMEETVQMLVDDGSLMRNGTVKLTRPLAELKIPATIQAILASRIDRLPSDAKDLLQTLAVIGREFPLSLVHAVVTKSDDELSGILNDLQLGEFVYEQPAVRDIEFTFKHALTQEVAYNSVLIERCKHLHEQIGAALERLCANSIGDHLDEVAHHYSRSGNVQKALEYYERAGGQAVQRSAFADAMRGLSAALELLGRLPESSERDQRELSIQTTLGQVLMITKGWAAPETERVYLRAQELAESGGTTTQRFLSLMGLLGISFAGGRMSDARERQELIRNFTSRHPEPAFMLEAHHNDWSLAFATGELEAAQRHIEDGLAFYSARFRSDPVPLYVAHHPAVCARAWGGIVLWLRGYPDRARRHSDKAVSLAHEVGHSPSVIFALTHKAHLHQIAREVALALETAETAVIIAENEGFPVFVAWARIVKGWALAQLGQAQQGIEQIREGLAMASATGSALWRTYDLALLADGCGKAGRIDEGLGAIVEALSLLQKNGERWWEAEIRRLWGELLLRQGDANLTEPENAIELAKKTARKQGAKSLELRATTSLARLLRDTGRRDEARAMLAEIYNWFTEGFDTTDLKDAKTLLDELSR